MALREYWSRLSDPFNLTPTLISTPQCTTHPLLYMQTNHVQACGSAQHQTNISTLRSRLDEWDKELNYLKFRIAEWKEFGGVDCREYYVFRQFLLLKLTDHMYTEVQILSSILFACLNASRSKEVLPQYLHLFYAFMERVAAGEIKQRMRIEGWARYSWKKDRVYDDERGMDVMFRTMRQEIAVLEGKSRDLRQITRDFMALVEDATEMGSNLLSAQLGHVQPRNSLEVPLKASTPLRHSFTASQISDARARIPPTPSILPANDVDLHISSPVVAPSTP